MRRIILIFLLFFVIKKARSQEDLLVYGYLQPHFTYFNSQYHTFQPISYNFGGLGQMNLFFQRYFMDGKMSAFVNFEITNNFNTVENWGSFKLQEAFLRYAPNDYVNFKFGYFLPKFNNLMEIFNRTPLLPYLHRPRLFETNNGSLINTFNILPQLGLVQADANIPVGNAYIDVAAYINHPTNSLISREGDNIVPGYTASGQSGTSNLGFGGRIGLRYDNLKIGFSATTDVVDLSNFTESFANRYREIFEEETEEFYGADPDDVYNRYVNLETPLGETNRLRLGADFSFSKYGFTLMGEYLMVQYDFTEEEERVFDDSDDAPEVSWFDEDYDFAYLPTGFFKSFYYVNLQYDFMDYYVFGQVANTQDDSDPWFMGLDGLLDYSMGAGWYVNDFTVLKLQYIRNIVTFPDSDENGNYVEWDYWEDWVAFGVSISF